MRSIRFDVLGLAMVVGAGCGSGDAPDGGSDPSLDGAYALADLLPHPADVEVLTPESSALSAVEWDPYYTLTRQVSGDVNSLVTNWLEVIHDIVRLTPVAESEDSWAWGPFHQGEGGLGPTTEYFFAERHPDGTYSYALMEAARADEDDGDAYVGIVAGKVLGGSGVEDSFGWFAVDFTAAASMDPTRETVGQAVFAYDFTGTYTAEWGGGPLVMSVLDDVSEVEGEGASGTYAYYRRPDGAGVLDLRVQEDIGASASEELWEIRSRWTADGAGRSDGRIAGGDLGATVVTLHDCWAETFTTVWYEDDSGWNEPAGSESACAFADESFPSPLPAWMAALSG
ncbi:hypothetical protein L6R50_14590 [Myxococcota bacterium]|nr:hypothetical protein [Myxococcota bacterium]